MRTAQQEGANFAVGNDVPTSASAVLNYRADIDGLRALAILPVVAYHAFPTILPGGFTGVDIFFVISGFLISGMLYADLERGRLNLFGFYARRIRRIFPALLLTLLITLGLGWLILLPGELAQLGSIPQQVPDSFLTSFCGMKWVILILLQN